MTDPSVIRSTSRLVALLALGLAGCGLVSAHNAGSFSMSIEWEGGQPPADLPSPVYARIRVLQAPGTTPVSGAGPVLYTPGHAVSLTAPDLPNGTGYSLVAEIVNSLDSTAQVLYYGVSPTFSIEAGSTPPAVTVVLTAVPYPQPGADTSAATPVIVMTGLQTPAGIPLTSQPKTVQLRLITSISPGSGGTVGISNAPGFVPGLTQLEPLTTADSSVPVPAGLTAYLVPWDLTYPNLTLPCQQPAGCNQTVYVHFQDANGEVSEVATNTVVVDQIPPGALSATVTYQPAPGSAVSNVTAAAFRSTVTVSIVPDEPIDTSAPAVLTAIVPTPSGDLVPIAFGAPLPFTSNELVFQAVISDTRLDGLTMTYVAPTITFADLAGNNTVNGPALNGTTPALIEVLTVPPNAPWTGIGGPIVYTRLPWGRDMSTDPAGCQALPGMPSYCSCPAKPGVPSFCVTGGMNAAPIGTTIAVFDGPTAGTASQIGHGTVNPNGSFGPITLDGIDRSVVYVETVDIAGNGTALPGARLPEVFNVQWIATFGGKVPGSTAVNPNVMETAPDFVLTPAPGTPTLLFAPATPGSAQEASSYAPFASVTTSPQSLAFAPAWRNVPSSSALPPSWNGTSMVYDSARGVSVLFGGVGELGGGSNSTWEWNGSLWTSNSPATSPPARTGQAMAYDSLHGVTVLFGGQPNSGALLQDTWEWTGAGWTSVAAPTPPPARQNAAMAYDAAHGVTLLFGGSDVNGKLLNDLWEWNGAVWTQTQPAASPPARKAHAMAFDAFRSRVVLFGGEGAAGVELNDVWEWDGMSWTAGAPPGVLPPARTSQAMAFDTVRGVTVVLGGCADGDPVTGCPDPLSDVWDWNGTSWTADGSAPAALSDTPAPSVTFDSARGALVLVGGVFVPDDGYSVYDSATWERSGAVWADRTQAPLPGAEFPAAMTYSGNPGSTLLSDNGGNASNDTWTWNGSSWSLVPTAFGPPPRTSHAVAPDATGGVVLFGGTTPGADWFDDPQLYPQFYNGSYLDDTWQWNGSFWTKPPGGAAGPSARADHTIVFDGTQSVLFGGIGAGGLLNDLWTWSGSTWTSLSPASPPSPRFGHAMAYDPTRSAAWLFGGCCDANGDELGDTWQWDGTSWTPQTPAHLPPSRAYASMVFDPGRATTLLFGGCTMAAAQCVAPSDSDVWEWDGTDWMNLSVAPGAVPPGRWSPAMAYDAAHGAAVLLGGLTASSGFYVNSVSDMWLLPEDPGGRPADLAQILVGDTGESAESLSLQQLTFSALAFGSGTAAPGTTAAGASLAAWDVSAGGWRVLVTNSSAGPVSTLTYTTASGQEASHYLRADPWDTINLAVFPSIPSGAGHAGALGVGYVEVAVSYQRQGCATNGDCTTAGTTVCDTASHQCVACLTSADCSQATTGMACDTTQNRCVQCTLDSQCSGPTPRCNALDQCVQCTAATDCPHQVCDATTNVCVGCLTSTDCQTLAPNGPPTCDTSSNTCVGCIVDGDCTESSPRCDQTTLACVACLSNADCTGNPYQFGAICDTATSKCVSCVTNADCAGTPGSPICASQTCVACQKDADCTNPLLPYCDTASQTCGGCTATNPCPAGQVCAADLCMSCQSPPNSCAVCTDTSDCAAGEACLVPTEGTAGTCQSAGTGLQCLGIALCQGFSNVAYSCSSGDAACANDCIAAGTPGAQAAYESWLNCFEQNCTGDCDVSVEGACTQEVSACLSFDCASDADCQFNGPGSPRCQQSTGNCVQCASDTDCAGTSVGSTATPRCDLSAGACVQCGVDTDCSSTPSTPFCNSGACAQCADSSQCTSGETCLNGTCASLPATLDCEGIWSCQQACDASDTACPARCLAAGSSTSQANFATFTACLSAGCPSAGDGTCDSTCETCRINALEAGACPNQPAECNGCLSSADCAFTPDFSVCQTTTGYCVACASDADCSSPTPHCTTAGECAACTESSQCGTGSACSFSACSAPQANQICSYIASACVQGCGAGDTSCLAACASTGSPAAQTTFGALVACLDSAGGDVCDVTSPAFEVSSCTSALTSALAGVGPCATQGAACEGSCTSTGQCGYDQCPSSGCICASGSCQPVLTGTTSLGCAGLLQCYAECAADDTGCEATCSNYASPQAIAGSNVVLSCLAGTCPGTGGGVCDPGAAGFDSAACAACVTTAEGAGGTCSAPWLACQPEGCGDDADCASTPETPHCAPASKSCVQCSDTSQCSNGLTCLNGVCDALAPAATCTTAVASLLACQPADAQCGLNAAASVSSAAEETYANVTDCLASACPDTGTGACNPTSSNYSEAGCQQCLAEATSAAAYSTLGACASAWAACSAGLCQGNDDCSGTPATSLCSPAGVCVECLQSSDCDGGTCLGGTCQQLPSGLDCAQIVTAFQGCSGTDPSCTGNLIATTQEPVTTDVRNVLACLDAAGCTGPEADAGCTPSSVCPTEWTWCEGNLCNQSSDCGSANAGVASDGGVPTPYCATSMNFVAQAGLCLQCVDSSQCKPGLVCLSGACTSLASGTTCSFAASCAGFSTASFSGQCVPSDSTCVSACGRSAATGDGGPSPRSDFQALATCLAGACDTTDGGTCDPSSGSFSLATCTQCRTSAEQGACASALSTCSSN